MMTKLTRKEIQNKFNKIMMENAFKKNAKLDDNFVDDLGMDSLDVVDLTIQCEEEFGIEIPDEDAVKIITVGDMISYLERNVLEAH